MKTHLSIDLSIVMFLLAAAGIINCTRETESTAFKSSWNNQHDRTWVGPDYWANRLHDWQINNGRLECINTRLPMRTVHLLTRRLNDKTGHAEMTVQTGLLAGNNSDASAGFLVGSGAYLDYRGAALVQSAPGPGGGLYAGIKADGRLFVRDFADENQFLILQKKSALLDGQVKLNLEIKMTANQSYLLRLSSIDNNGKQTGHIEMDDIAATRIIGNVALVCDRGDADNPGRFWFSDWTVKGIKFDTFPERICGPILAAQYTLSDHILKMTAQMMPVGKYDNQTVTLKMKKETWQTVASTNIIIPGYTAPFRVENLTLTDDTPYRVEYEMQFKDGSKEIYTWSGTIKRNPLDEETIVVAGFTGNHNVKHGFGREGYPFTEQAIWFPHNDIVDHVAKHEPHVLFFSGDQVYEGASPTFADRQHIQMDYLYKWYLWCWAFRDLAKDRPCICIPDDHDVYQGNLWGEGGRKIDKDDKGGYVHPAEFVKMVERTQTSHFPDPFDPTPIDQGIGVYYTDMTYGGIGFAILEDRKFKSGCNGRVKGTNGRADHILDPDYDVEKADIPGLKLLGDRQLEFLNTWTADWHDQEMKIALSQTIFAGMATHHGPSLTRLYGDLDSNGWPQSGRNRAIKALRKGFVFHLAGDQHLSHIVHHGVGAFNDAIWSFCVPSIANFYPRAWWPEEPGKNRPQGAPTYLGEHHDGLGNRVTVYAVTNPTAMTGQSTGVKPLELHDKMPGYGILRLNKNARTITIECWPRYTDPDDPDAKQYEGWPKTIHQRDNYGRQAAAYLPTVRVIGLENPIVQVIDQETEELVYALRIQGTEFKPQVFKSGNYTLKIGEQKPDRMKIFRDIPSYPKKDVDVLEVKF